MAIQAFAALPDNVELRPFFDQSRIGIVGETKIWMEEVPGHSDYHIYKLYHPGLKAKTVPTGIPGPKPGAGRSGLAVNLGNRGYFQGREAFGMDGKREGSNRGAARRAIGLYITIFGRPAGPGGANVGIRKNFLAVLTITMAGLPGIGSAETFSAGPISFNMQVIDSRFRAEAIAIADINKDGQFDVTVGDYWYAGPAWTRHAIKSPAAPDYAVDKYSEAFNVWTEDFNGDGYLDQLVMPFPMKPIKWYANPMGGTGAWTGHEIGFGYTNEHPQFQALRANDPKRYLVMGTGTTGINRISYFGPEADPTRPWKEIPVSPNGTASATLYSHGLGLGDLNRDNRKDILEANGWYEQTADPARWTFHAKDFLPHDPKAPLNTEVSAMFVHDINGDGLMDIVTSSSHGYGVWWFEQKAGGAWVKHDIDISFSESHSLRFEDMDNDGKPDIITGKRWYAHNGGDPGALGPALLVWYKYTLSGNTPTFERYVIKGDSAGVGTDFEVGDFNADGYKDIAVANKTGVKVYMQVKTAAINRHMIRKKNESRDGAMSVGGMPGLFFAAPWISSAVEFIKADGRHVIRRKK